MREMRLMKKTNVDKVYEYEWKRWEEQCE